MGRADRERGLTLVEIAVSVVILSMVFGIVGTSLGVSFRVWSASAAPERAVRQSHGTVHRIADLLVFCGSRTILPPAPSTGPSLTFRRLESFAAGERVWGPLRRIEWRIEPGESADGLDNDGDGFVDEGSVVLLDRPGEPDERATVLVRGVARFLEGEEENGMDDNDNGLVDEPGLVFRHEPGMVTIHLTLSRRGPDGAPDTRTVRTSVRMRN